MTNSKPRTAALLRSAVRELQQGASKTSVFTKYRSLVSPNRLALRLANVPDHALYRRYRPLHLLLFILFVVYTVFETAVFLSSLFYYGWGLFQPYSFVLTSIVINLVTMILLVRKTGVVYKPLGYFFMVSAARSLTIVIPPVSSFSFTMYAAGLLFNMGMGVLCIILGFRMFPYLSWLVPEMDETGIYTYTTEQQGNRRDRSGHNGGIN